MTRQTETLLVPFVYMASVVKPRKRKPEWVAISDIAEINILRVPDVSALSPAFSFDDEIPSETSIYSFAGGLWSKGQGGCFSAIKTLIDNNYQGYPYSCPSEDAPFFNCWNSLPQSRNTWLCDACPAADLMVRSWLGDTKQEVQDLMQGIANSLLIVGDELYYAASEPAYYVMTFGLGRNHGGTSLTQDVANHPLDDERCFAADDLDNAIQYASKIASDRGDTKNLPMKPDCRIICHPGAVVTRRHSQAASQTTTN